MALGKELINEKGVKTTYHRIDSISMVEGIKVIVKSYTDESYRQQEKENEALIEKQEAIKAALQIEMEKMCIRDRCICKKIGSCPGLLLC